MYNSTSKFPCMSHIILMALITGFVVFAAPVSGQIINEDFKLLADDGAEADLFGFSIDIDNGIVAVGAYRNHNNPNPSGTAFLFDASTGALIDELFLVEDLGGRFGWSIGIDSGIVAIGAPWDGVDGPNGALSGSAYLFDASTGEQLFKLIASDAAKGDQFGWSIAIDNGIVAVGSRLAEAVYLFDVSTGHQVDILLPKDGEFGVGFFGRSIAIGNDVVAVGAYGSDVNGSTSGSAYLFDASTGAYIVKLLPSDGAANDQFGRHIAVDEGVVVVGAWGHDDFFTNSGAAYLFEASTGKQITKLLPNDAGAYDVFGSSVSIDNGIIAVGARGDGIAGSAYIFDASTGTQVAKLLASDGIAHDRFGISIAMDNGIVAVGADQ